VNLLLPGIPLEKLAGCPTMARSDWWQQARREGDVMTTPEMWRTALVQKARY